jgi:hypothetical protein
MNDQHRAGIIANATSLIEAAKAAYARQEAMMANWHLLRLLLQKALTRL